MVDTGRRRFLGTVAGLGGVIGTPTSGRDGTRLTDSPRQARSRQSVDDGDVRWLFGTSGATTSPTVVDGTAYIGSNDGSLYAIEAGVAGSSDGSRVHHGTLGHHYARAGNPEPGAGVGEWLRTDGVDAVTSTSMVGAVAVIAGATYAFRRWSGRSE